MHFKALIFSTALLLPATATVNAADAIIAPEPEPTEYVRVCDAYGTGYFYIPGTETCLRISGAVRYMAYAGENAYDSKKFKGWKKNSRFALRTATASETELGTLKTATETRFNWNSTASGIDGVYGGTEIDGTAKGGQTTSVGFKYAYIELGGFRIGVEDSSFQTFSDYLGNVLNDDVVSPGSYRTGKIAYTFKSDNGLSATISLEGGGDDSLGYKEVVFEGNKVGKTNSYVIDGYVPHIVGGVKYEQGWGKLALVAGYDSVIEEWSGKLRADANLSDKFSVFAVGAYSSAETDNQNFGQWGGNWAVWTGATFKPTKKASFNIQGAYEEWGKTAVSGNVIYTLVEGLTITPEVSYTKWNDGHYRRVIKQVNKDALQGMIRIQRNF